MKRIQKNIFVVLILIILGFCGCSEQKIEEMQKNVITRLANDLLSRHASEYAKEILQTESVIAYFETTETSLDFIPTRLSDVRGKAEGNLTIFTEEMLDTEKLPSVFDTYKRWLLQNELYGCVRLIILQPDTIQNITEDNYTEYLSGESYITKEEFSVSSDDLYLLESTPLPIVTPEPTAPPEPTATPMPTATPKPTSTPTPTPFPLPTLQPDAADTGLFQWLIIGAKDIRLTGVNGELPEHLVIPNVFRDRIVKEIGMDAFKENTQIRSVVIPQGVTRISTQTFYNCSNLTEVTLPEGLKEIGMYCFWGVPLKEITIPGTVKKIEQGAFIYCKFKNVILKEGIETIGPMAFTGCDNLTQVTIPNGVQIICDRAFWGCNNLTQVTIPGSVKTIEENAFVHCNKLSDVSLSDGITYIGYQAFSGNNLSEIFIPESVTFIGERAFAQYKAGEDGDILNYDNLTIITKEGSYADSYAKENGIPVRYQ